MCVLEQRISLHMKSVRLTDHEPPLRQLDASIGRDFLDRLAEHGHTRLHMACFDGDAIREHRRKRGEPTKIAHTLPCGGDRYSATGVDARAVNSHVSCCEAGLGAQWMSLSERVCNPKRSPTGSNSLLSLASDLAAPSEGGACGMKSTFILPCRPFAVT
eukprot:scaffold40574_cov27-Tisochrysis_lutea.AAC.5